MPPLSASDDELVILSTSILYFYKTLQESVLFHLNMFYFIFFSFPHAVTHWIVNAKFKRFFFQVTN